MAAGSCEDCGAALAPEQRYCIACGLRTSPPIGAIFIQNPNVPPAQASPLQPQGAATAKWLPVPPQMASAFGAMAIGFGVVIGSAISPGVETVLSSGSPPLVAAAPVPEPPIATPPAGGGGGGSSALPGASSVAATTESAGGSGGGGDGGGHKKKKKKKKRPAAATTVVGTVVHVNPLAGRAGHPLSARIRRQQMIRDALCQRDIEIAVPVTHVGAATAVAEQHQLSGAVPAQRRWRGA